MLTRTSHSNMDRAEKCPRSWKLHYAPEGEREEEEAPIQLSGKAAHELIAHYLKHLRANGLQSDFAFVDETMENPPAKLEALCSLDPEGFRQVWDIGRRFADAWVDPLDQSAIIEEWAEAKFEVELPGTGELVEVSLVGVIDRMSQENDLPVITDWKTGWASLTPKAMSEDPQTRLYALILLEDPKLRARAFPLGRKPITIRQVYPRLGMLVRETTIDPEEWDDLAAEVAHRIRRWWNIVEGPEYPATPGHHCSFCAFRRDCPAILDGLYGYPTFLVTNDEEAQEAARKVQAMRAAISEQMAHLRSWVGERGPITTDDHVLGYHRATAPVIEDVEEALALIEQVPGLTPGEVLATSTPKLRKALNTYPLLRELDPGIIGEKVSTRFDFAKPKEETECRD